MATTKQPVKNPPASQQSSQASKQQQTRFLFDRMNYYILGGGIFLLIVGYVLMSGGQQASDQFKFEEVYSFRRITLAPIIVVLGYVVIGYGIMKRPAE